MCRHLHLNLDVLPWPINVLKFSQAVHDLQPGDDMTASITDDDVVGNLRQLLRSQANVRYDVTRSKNDSHIIHVTRARAPL